MYGRAPARCARSRVWQGRQELDTTSNGLSGCPLDFQTVERQSTGLKRSSKPTENMWSNRRPRSYYFDHASRSCRMFWGCDLGEKSGNNFPDLLTCQWKCEPERATPNTRSCLDPLDPTLEDDCNGGKFVTKFHFDFATKKCVSFHYGGCRSPSTNVFDGAEHCKTTCERPDHTVAQSCMESFDRGFLNTCNVNGRFEPKYFYDGVKGKCEMFWWGGCRRSASNFFASLETCKWSCERPKKADGPQQCQDRFDKKLSESCEDGKWRERFFFDHESGKCSPFWWDGCYSESANFFRDQESCTELCEHAANADIGESHTLKEEFRCLEPKKVGECRETYPAYYYDRSHRECRPFSYSGCGGNGNRFLTLSQCDTLCKPFTALSESESACFLPLDTGHSEGECGKEAQISWHYDRAKGACAEFWFRGCGGNDNRFNSKSACSHVCSTRRPGPPPIRKTRSTHACFEAPADKGSCDGGGNKTELKRYTFASTGKCMLFTWSGCGGSDNRFTSFEECTRLCNGLQPSHSPAICSYDIDWGPCNQLRHQYAFNQSTGFCEQFLYGGCGGNPNRFDDFSTCQKTCEISGLDICLEKQDRGQWCDVMTNKVWYNFRKKQCEGFHYSGCGKSNNLFDSLEECAAKCSHRLNSRSLDEFTMPPYKTVTTTRSPMLFQQRRDYQNDDYQNDREERQEKPKKKKKPKKPPPVGTGYKHDKPVEKTPMRPHIILEGNGTTYHVTKPRWVEHELCYAYRYNVTGINAKLETHLCAKEASNDCWSEVLPATGGDEFCHIVKPFLKGTHKYTWFFSLLGGYHIDAHRKSKQGLRAAIMILEPSHCDQIC